MMAAKQTYQGEGVCLTALLQGILDIDLLGLDRVTVLGLSTDSRRIGPGDLFLACGGLTTKGHKFIHDAVRYGACAVLYDSVEGLPDIGLEKSVPVVAVDDLSSKIGLLAARFFQNPSKGLVVTGVTGTNGKTSCSHILAHALSKATASPAGVLGTLGYGVCGELEKASHTTPDAITVHRLMDKMRRCGTKDVVMEVSSHGLHQGRIVGVDVDVAVLTNISRDHLDYHQTMQAYVDAKRRLFSWPSLKCAVINLDDAYASYMFEAVSPGVERIGYTLGGSEKFIEKSEVKLVRGSILNASTFGSEVLVKSEWGEASFKTSLIGEFNVSNLLAALSVLLWRGVDFDEALARLATVRPLLGRMEVVANAESSPTVIIDYAHTPDALEKALTTIKHVSACKLWCVFGCGGNRDQGKRAQMGRIAQQYADEVVVTDDNPRFESPRQIVDDILSGMSNRESVHTISNREQAVAYALNHATAGDVVLIAGKGHEDYQDVQGQRTFFSDHAVVLSLLSAEEQS